MTDQETANQLVVKYMWIARDEARKFHTRMGCRLDFDDLYSEALMVMTRASRHFQPELGCFKAFIRRAINNGMIDYVRGRRHQPATLESFDVGELSILDSRRSLDPDDREAMDQACENMSWKCRFLLTLRYHGGMSFREIAEIMGITQMSVQALHSQIISRIRQRSA